MSRVDFMWRFWAVSMTIACILQFIVAQSPKVWDRTELLKIMELQLRLTEIEEKTGVGGSSIFNMSLTRSTTLLKAKLLECEFGCESKCEPNSHLECYARLDTFMERYKICAASLGKLK